MKLTDVRFRRKASPADSICQQNDGVLEHMLKGFEDEPFAVLRRKWSEVPAGDERLSTVTISQMATDELTELWQKIRHDATTGKNFDVRGWYHILYKDILRGKRVMDVGCGLGIDGITFADAGAHVTFVDIVDHNLEVVQRICHKLGLTNIDFCYLNDLSALDQLGTDYDGIWCQGSMINAPFSVMREESQKLLRHLRIGGRWIELAYPKARWEREGRLPFHQWGKRTDGPGTPWVEWYDLPKLLQRLAPATFDVVLELEFHDSDFNWFDLVRRS